MSVMQPTNFVPCTVNVLNSRCVRAACERCHDRKVRCDIGGGKSVCSNCEFYGQECILRERRRYRTAQRRRTRSDTAQQGEINPPPAAPASAPPPPPPALPTPPPPPPPPLPEQLDCAAEGRRSSTSQSLPKPGALGSPGSAHEHTIEVAQEPVKDGLQNVGVLCRAAYWELPTPASHQHTAPSPRNEDYILSETKLKVLELFNAMEIPPLQVCQSLVEAYFDFCWTWMPVVDLSLRDTAATSLWTDPALSKPESPLLMNAMLLAGSRMRRGTKYASSQEYYTRAKILVDMEVERNPQRLLGALCMMQWWNAYNPQDVSTTSSRFWITYAIGLAQQMGLHLGRTLPGQDKSQWKRLWWTLYTRDCLIAAAHGRPRIINREDCSIDAITVHDFPPGHEFRGLIFVHYVKISEILCDLCRALTRTPGLPSSSRETIAARLLEWTQSLPDELRLYNSDGSSRPHQFEAGQLHVYFLTALCILYRPRSISTIGPENTVAVLASSLSHRLLEGFQLRDLARYLAPIFTWCTVVAAIPQLSCSVVPTLWKESREAVGDLHGILVSLSLNWPSATFNSEELERLQKIADNAAANHHRSQNSQRQIPTVQQSASGSDQGLALLFNGYGEHAQQRYQQIHSILASSMDASYVVPVNGGPSASQVQLPADAAEGNINCQPSSDQLNSLTSQMDQTYPGLATLPSEGPISYDEMESNWYDLDWSDLLVSTGAHDLVAV